MGPLEDAGRQTFNARIGLKCSEAIKTELEVYQIENLNTVAKLSRTESNLQEVAFNPGCEFRSTTTADRIALLLSPFGITVRFSQLV